MVLQAFIYKIKAICCTKRIFIKKFCFFFFKLLLNHFIEDFSDFCSNVFAVPMECQWRIRTVGLLGAILLVSDLPPILMFLVCTTYCLTENRSGSKQSDDNCPLQIDFSVRSTGFGIFLHSSHYCTQSQINQTKYFFSYFLEKRTSLFIYRMICASLSIS